METDPLKIVAQFLSEQQLKDNPVLVGFSGGADSCALLLALWQLEQPLTAVHFQHGLRGQKALEEEIWCREFCQQRKIPFHSQCLHVPQQKQAAETIEEAARRLRLEAWQKLSQNGRVPVFLAHHADDCLEDIFIRLARGANSSGLVGMRSIRRVGELLLCRPFLDLRKKELENFLCSQAVVHWCYDASNQDNQFRRNAVRNRLLPEFRRIFRGDAGLLQSRRTLLEDAEFLEELAEQYLPSMTSRSAWQALPPALLPRVLRLWLKQEFSQDIPPSASLCQRLKNALGKNNGRGEIIPAGAGRQLFLDQNGLRRWRAPIDELKCRQWNWQSEPCLLLPEYDAFLSARQKNEKTKAPGEILALESFDRAKLPENLQVRSWRPGDLMIPFGGDFRKKLQDLFTEVKIPRDQRSRIPILLAAEKIIWLPTVRRAEFARTEKQQEIIVIEYGKL